MKRLLMISGLMVLGLVVMCSNAQAAWIARNRQVQQQERIGQGRAAGRIAPRETRVLEREQVRIQHQMQSMRADGRFTPAERVHFNHLQDRASRHIHYMNHNQYQRNWKVQDRRRGWWY